MAQPLPQKNVQEGIEPITITLQISSPTIEPQPKVGEVPIVRSSDLDLDLPTSDYDLFRRF